MKPLLFFLFFILISGYTLSQKTNRKLEIINQQNASLNKVRYEVSASANALMCPFLSPKLMDKLSKSGADSLYRDDKLILHFITTKDKEIQDVEINKIIEGTGYQSKNFRINRKYEK